MNIGDVVKYIGKNYNAIPKGHTSRVIRKFEIEGEENIEILSIYGDKVWFLSKEFELVKKPKNSKEKLESQGYFIKQGKFDHLPTLDEQIILYKEKDGEMVMNNRIWVDLKSLNFMADGYQNLETIQLAIECAKEWDK